MPRHATTCLFLVLVLVPHLQAGDKVGYSGMVRIADNSYGGIWRALSNKP